VSFFDDVDEPPRRPPRAEPRRSRPSGRRRPPADQQIQTRRIVAVVALVIVVVLIALLVNSCEVSARNSSLKDYNTSVYNLVKSSDETGAQLFSELKSSAGSADVTGLESQINATLKRADNQLQTANSLSAPGQLAAAQEHLVLALRMRRDGIATISKNIEQALGTSTSSDAVDAIAAAGADFYASDVLYKDYTLPEIVGQLHAANIPVGGVDGQAVWGGQFLTDRGWLDSQWVATTLGARLPSSSHFQPGLHGHSLNSVSVGSNTMAPGVTNHVPASPAPMFALNITNGGHFTEFDVKCKVSIKGLSDTGTGMLSETTPNQTTNCDVTLPSPPTPGTYSVTAEVLPVRGEKHTSNNFETFTVDFTS
jgi:hypothetical protein